MHIEIFHIHEIESPEEQEFYEKLIYSFKSQLEDAFSDYNIRLPYRELQFYFDKKNRKFSVKEIPIAYKIAFDRVFETNAKIRRWF